MQNSCKHKLPSRHDNGVTRFKPDVLLGILALYNVLVVEGDARLTATRSPVAGYKCAFCLAKSRNPPAAAIASKTVVATVSEYDPGFITCPKTLNFSLWIS